MFTSHEGSSQEAFDKNMHHYETIKTISRTFSSKREYSVQEAVYHIRPELKLRRVVPAVHFVNTNVPEESMQIFFIRKG